MDAGAWIAVGSLIIAAGSMIVAVISNRGNVTRSEIARIETLKSEARTGYVDEVKAELDLFRQKFEDADKHMRTCEDDLRRLRAEHGQLRAQNFYLMQTMIPKNPLIIQAPPDEGS